MKLPPISTIAHWLKDHFTFSWAEQRDVIGAFGLAIAMNVSLWVMRQLWFSFNPSIAWYGSLILGLNVLLSLVFARKGHVFAQALAVTAVVAELLLLILIVRTGLAGV